jgi:hypothetical protein
MRELQHNEPKEVFDPKREDVKGDSRKLHDQELHDLYFSAGIIKVIK